MNIKPFDTNLLVRREKAPEKSAGGILLPENARPHSNIGVVAAIGSSDKIRSKVGDRVLLHGHVYNMVHIDGVEYLLLTEADLIGTIA